jgi:hypothetical protein
MGSIDKSTNQILRGPASICPFADAVGPRHSPPPKPSVARPLAETSGELTGSQPALLFEQDSPPLTRLIQKEAHFGMYRFEIRRDALLA